MVKKKLKRAFRPEYDPRREFVPLVGDFVPGKGSGRGLPRASVRQEYNYPVERGGLEEGIVSPEVIGALTVVAAIAVFFLYRRK